QREQDRRSRCQNSAKSNAEHPTAGGIICSFFHIFFPSHHERLFWNCSRFAFVLLFWPFPCRDGKPNGHSEVYCPKWGAGLREVWKSLNRLTGETERPRMTRISGMVSEGALQINAPIQRARRFSGGS